MRILSSTNKDKVIEWAASNNRPILWKDEYGKWHAAVGMQHVPKYAVAVEKVRP